MIFLRMGTIQMKTRNCNLDLIKCLACLGVVGLHSVGMVNYTIYYLCGISVPLFFMVNGYLMFSRSSLPYSYALRKIGNLLIPVIGWNILILIPVVIVRHKFVNPITLFLKSLFQQGYLWHFWFFGSLILIYLVMPLLYRLLHDHTPCPVTALHASCPLQHLSLPVIHAQGLQYPAVCSPDAPPLDMAVLFPLWRSVRC